jgi:hypothetical protein
MHPTTRIGAVLLPVLDLIVIVFPIVGLVVGVLTLAALALWAAGRAPCAAMWVGSSWSSTSSAWW